MPEPWQIAPWGSPPPPQIGDQLPEVAANWGMGAVTGATPEATALQLAQAPVSKPPAIQPTSRPQKPMSFDQSLAQQQQREDQALGLHNASIDANTQAELGQHAEQGQALHQNLSTLQASEDQRKKNADALDKARMQNKALIDADSKAVDNFKIDPDKYMKELGVGGHIRYGIGMVLAGIGQGMMRQGGPNPVLQMMQDKIKQNIEAQHDQRDQLLGKLGRDRQSMADTEKTAGEKQAEIDRQIGFANTVLAKQFDIAANNAADPRTKALALQGKAQSLDTANVHHEKAIELQSQHDYQKQQLGLEGARLGETIRHNKIEEGWQRDKFDQEQQLKAAALLAKQQGKLSEEETKRAVFVPAPDGSWQPLRNKSGEVILAGSPEIAQKQKDMAAGATAYNRLVGQMVRSIKDHGGESTWIKGKEWQKMMSDLQSATAELHDAYGITSFREPTVEFFEKMATSGVDPTSFARDASAALVQSNQNLQAKVNEKLGALGYDGAKPAFQVPDTTNPPEPKDTAADQVKKTVLAGPDPGATFNTELNRWEPKIPGLQNPAAADVSIDKPGSAAPYVQREHDAIARKYPGLGSGKRAILDIAYDQTLSQDAGVRAQGSALLESAAKDASKDDVADYARYLLGKTPDTGDQATAAGRLRPVSRAPARPEPVRLPPEVLRGIGL